MYSRIIGQLELTILVALLFGSSVVTALEIKPGVGAGLQYTNNAALTSDDEDDDLIVKGYLGANVSENTGPVNAHVLASLVYEKYTDNTFGDQYNFNLNSNAQWDIIRDRLNWQVADYFTRIRTNSLDSDTPDNQENANAFSTGPSITFSISPRNSLFLNPVFRDFYYEDSDTDNQQYELGGQWSYQMYRTMDVGPVGRVTKIDYENDQIQDYTISFLGIRVNGRRPRSAYTVNLGKNYVQRDGFDNVSGFDGDVNFRYSLTGSSSLRAYASKVITDASSDLLRSEEDPDTGDFQNEQITGDILRNSTARLAYSNEGSTLDTSFWLQYRDFDYKEQPDDRTVKSIGAKLGYNVTPLMRTDINGRYDKVKQTDINRTDKKYLVGGALSYSLSRDLLTSFRIEYRKKDSTVDKAEYNEFSAYINLVYGFRIADIF